MAFEPEVKAMDCVYRKAPDASVRQGERACLSIPVRNVDGRLESLVALNETASFIWDILDGRRSVADVCREVVEEFAVSPQVAAEDIQRLLGELSAHGFLETVNDSSMTFRPTDHKPQIP